MKPMNDWELETEDALCTKTPGVCTLVREMSLVFLVKRYNKVNGVVWKSLDRQDRKWKSRPNCACFGDITCTIPSLDLASLGSLESDIAHNIQCDCYMISASSTEYLSTPICQSNPKTLAE
jgi:hypothetical protein